MKIARPGWKKLIEKTGEQPGHHVPAESPVQAILPHNRGFLYLIWKQ